MSGHPHADLMAKAAEIAKTDKEWWMHFEVNCLVAPETRRWMEPHGAFIFNVNSEYRPKPRYIDINGHQVPEPVREPLEIGRYYVVADTTIGGLRTHIWQADDVDMFLLQRGLIHLTKEAAEAHIAALLSFTQK